MDGKEMRKQIKAAIWASQTMDEVADLLIPVFSAIDPEAWIKREKGGEWKEKPDFPWNDSEAVRRIKVVRDGIVELGLSSIDPAKLVSELDSILSSIDREAIRPSEDTEKLCHQIYDVLPISPAMKLLDDGKLHALISAHDEAIRGECADRNCAICERFYEHTECGGTREKPYRPDHCRNRAAILSAEPAKDDGKPEVVGAGDIVAYVFTGGEHTGGEYTVEQDFSDDTIRRWKDRPFKPVILMRVAEVKRRIEEAKE